MMKDTEVLFALLRAGLTGEPVSAEVQAACTEEILEKVYNYARQHGVVPIVGQALSKMQVQDCEVVDDFKKATFMAVYRYGQIKFEYERICKVLEEDQIPFIPLKGAVIRNHYPEPWLRTSGDVDILVKEEDLDRAVDLLVSKLQYHSHGRAEHDVSLTGANCFLLELHFTLLQTPGKAKNILDKVWDDAKPIAPRHCQHVLSNEMFCFYHLAHMAKHVQIGGSGIRSFVDLWIMGQKIQFDTEKLKALLEKGDRLAFARAAGKLVDYWFNGEKPDQWTKYLETYILSGKMFGSNENRVLIKQKVYGGGIRYILGRIFLPYEQLKESFPILKKYKWLTPIYHVVRWIRLISMGRFLRSAHELSVGSKITDETRDNTYSLIEHLGLEFKY